MFTEFNSFVSFRRLKIVIGVYSWNRSGYMPICSQLLWLKHAQILPCYLPVFMSTFLPSHRSLSSTLNKKVTVLPFGAHSTVRGIRAERDLRPKGARKGKCLTVGEWIAFCGRSSLSDKGRNGGNSTIGSRSSITSEVNGLSGVYWNILGSRVTQSDLHFLKKMMLPVVWRLY